MPAFSENEIEAAKRRVQEMRNRASKFKEEEAQDFVPFLPEKDDKLSGKSNSSNHNDENEQAEEKEPLQDKSFVLILALILILSQEGADNKLILALLYLLL
ncbi:MAG: hypothetical protein NC213_04245 [Acetobacter sp.]|nr:hypothetical protein [Bacteroides sp.]MCM1340935.1 hypothetical protein [Acetobacter sp.]MCM1432509.1 hypothetical protein [Clostridiales bacterium]